MLWYKDWTIAQDLFNKLQERLATCNPNTNKYKEMKRGSRLVHSPVYNNGTPLYNSCLRYVILSSLLLNCIEKKHWPLFWKQRRSFYYILKLVHGADTPFDMWETQYKQGLVTQCKVRRLISTQETNAAAAQFLPLKHTLKPDQSRFI